MQLVKYILLYFLLFIHCSTKNKNGMEIGNLLLIQGLLSTSYEPCPPKVFTNSLSFTDPAGDVKAGNFQFVQPAQGLRDLVSGKIEKTEEQLKLTFGLSKLPNAIRISNSGQKNIPEYKWIYEFKSQSKELTVGIVLYSNGISETKSMSTIPIEVFENKNSIASCGYPTIANESIHVICDFQSIPVLKNLNSEYIFNVIVENYDNQNIYKDCY